MPSSSASSSSSSSSSGFISRRGLAGSAALGLLGLGAGSASGARSVPGGGPKGNGPPRRNNGVGLEVRQKETLHDAATFRFENSNKKRDPEPGDSFWVFVQDPGVIMTSPDNIKAHDLVPPLDGYIRAYLVKPGQQMDLLWPTDSTVVHATRPWLEGDK